MTAPNRIVRLWDVMQEIALNELFNGVWFSSGIQHTAIHGGGWPYHVQIKPKLEKMADGLRIVHMPTSAATVDRLISEIEAGGEGPVAVDSIENQSRQSALETLRTLANVIGIEAHTIRFYVMPNDHIQYECDHPFGSRVSDRFQSCAYDIAESGKCIAFSRSTAAVYHLMRVMEIGALAVARCLGLHDPVKPSDRNLGNKLKDIKGAIATKWPTSASRMSGDGAIFEDIYASLEARKDPWRNATNHPDRVYTLDEAKEIYIATKGLMQKIAQRCDENGDPKA